MLAGPHRPLRAGDRRLSIGVFARLTQLTRKALKTYERYGLLVPAHVDPESHYRYYSLQQVRTAETIRLLRSVGVPLRDVAAALRENEATPLPALLARRRQQLAEQLAATDRLLDHLSSGSADSSGCLTTEITERVVAAHVDLVCTGHCTHETHEATVDRLLDRLAGLLRSQGLDPLGRETATYFADFDLTHDYRVEVSVPVGVPYGEGDALPPACRHTPAATVATAVHRGPYGEMYTTSACLIAWIAERDLPVTGRFSETYLVDERDTDDPEAFSTLIGFEIAGSPDPTRA